jgi:hypothetical protein
MPFDGPPYAADRGRRTFGVGNRDAHSPLPNFIARAQQEERTRQALARQGYRRVLATYSWQRKNAIGDDAFYGLTSEGLTPNLDFVADWLRTEKRRIWQQVRSTFFAAMLSAIGVGLIFGVALILFK